MTTFATDKDLLHWEPSVFSDAANVAQTMLSGSGDLEGTEFSIVSSGSVSLTDARVAAGNVIFFTGSIAGSYPIIEIVNSTKLKLSVLYDQIIEQPLLAPAAPPGWSDGLSFAIRTFWPQRQAVSDAILTAARIDSQHAEFITNPAALRRPCVLGTLELIHLAIAASADDPTESLARAELYQSLYRRSLRAVTLALDFTGDGKVDERRSMNVVDLKRG